MPVEEKVARLSLIVDSSQAENAAISLERLVESGKLAEDQTRKITSEAKKAAAPMKSVAESVKAASTEFENISDSGKIAAKNVENIAKAAPKTAKSFDEIGKSTKDTVGSLNQYTEKANSAVNSTAKINKEFANANLNFGSFANSSAKASLIFGDYVTSSKEASKYIAEYNKNLKDIAPSLQNSSQFIQKMNSQFNGFGTNIKNTSYGIGAFADNLQSINSHGSGVSSTIRSASDEVRKFGINSSQSSRIVKDNFQGIETVAIDIKSAMGDLASSLLPIATVSGAVAGLNQLKNEAAGFQTAIAQVSTILDDESRLDDISASAKEAALEFGKLPTDQVKAFYDILSAGVESVSDAQKILIAGNKLAIGGSADFNIATKGIISTLNTYGLSAEKAGDVTDSFFVAAKAGALSIEDLSAGIGNIASIAQPAGVGLEELLSSIAALTNGGVSTSQAITNIRSAISSIITPSKQASDAAASIGLEFSAAALKSKGFTKFMDEIRVKSNGNSEILGKLFGSIEALSGAQALVGTALGDFNGALDQMKSKSGATEIAYAKMADTFEKKADKLNAKFALLRIQMGEKILEGATPALESINENFEEIINTVELATKIAGAYVVAVYGIPLAAAAASKAMFILTSGIQAYISSATVANASTLTLKNSLGLLAAAFVGWEIGKYLRENFEVVEKAGIAMASGLHEIAIRLEGNYELLGEKMKIALTSPLSFIKNEFIEFAEDWVDIAVKFYDAIGADDLAADIDRKFTALKDTVVDNNTAALDKIKAETESEVNAMKDIYADMFSSVGKGFDELAKKKKESNSGDGGSGSTTVNPQSVAPIVIDEDAIKKQAREAEKLQNKYDQILENMKSQVQLTKDSTEVEQIRFQLANTELAKLNSAQKRELLNYAEAIDKIAEINEKKKEQQKIDEQSQEIADRLNPAAAIERKYLEERKIILDSQKITKEEETALLLELEQEKNDALMEASDNYWDRWLKSAEDNLLNFEKMSEEVINNFTAGFGDAFEQMIFDSKNLEDAMTDLAENMLRAITNAIGQMIAQWVAYQAIQLITGKSTQAAAATQLTANAYAMALMGGINAFASTAAIPMVGPFMAPGAMAAAEAILQPMATAVSSLAIAGMAHEGIMSVPEDGTWLLKKGERVTSENTSKKLDKMLDSAKNGMGGKNITQVFNIQTPNADSFRTSERQLLKSARRSLQ